MKYEDLDELKKLVKGWDGYQGDCTTDAAIESAKQIDFIPTCDGGIYVAFHGELVSLSISADGKIGDVSVDFDKLPK